MVKTILSLTFAAIAYAGPFDLSSPGGTYFDKQTFTSYVVNPFNVTLPWNGMVTIFGVGTVTVPDTQTPEDEPNLVGQLPITLGNSTFQDDLWALAIDFPNGMDVVLQMTSIPIAGGYVGFRFVPVVGDPGEVLPFNLQTEIVYLAPEPSFWWLTVLFLICMTGWRKRIL